MVLPPPAPSSAPNVDADALFRQGLALHQQGQLDPARALYGEVLQVQPHHVEALHLLGVVAYQLRDAHTAVRLIGQALAVQPAHAVALANRGLALRDLGRLPEALASFDAAIRLRPGHASAHAGRATVLLALQRPAEAVASFDQVLALRPDHLPAWHNRGVARLALGRPAQALADFDAVIARQPGHVDAHSNRGVALHALGRAEEAVASCDRAIALQPGHAQAHSNRGMALQALDRFTEAIASCDQALALRPGYVEALYNRGLALQALNRLDEALASFDQAIAHQPDHGEAQWTKALVLLLAGRFEEGWAQYEWRWKNPKTGLRPRGFAQPLWRGAEDLRGQTLLLYSEQGLGDTLQFCRYAAQVQALGARVVLEVPAALRAVLQGLAGVDTLVAQGEPLPAFDRHCPVLSLPLAFKTRLATVPAPSPYLASDPARRALWAQRLGPRTRPRVGLVWAGNAAHQNDRQRSLALAQLLPSLPGHCVYLGLQKELRDGDAALMAAHGVPHLGGQLQDFSDTAALCDLLDLVVSVDTSVAHLAGALGRPTWLLLPFAPDWRWLLDRDDSPWYPSMRLYRQGADRQWAPVLASLAQNLAALRM